MIDHETLPVRLLCLGLSHETAPVELRERMSQWREGWHAEARMLHGVQEVLAISTCNRLELYAAVSPEVADPRQLLTVVMHLATGIEMPTFRQFLYYYEELDAARHLCRVACGLESLVLGEAQILGQVTDAYRDALAERQVGPYLLIVFRMAIRAGKRARSETAIGMHAVSVSSIAIDLAEQVVGDLRKRALLVIGLGEMGQLALKSLRARRLSQVAIANRSPERAAAVAEPLGWSVFGLDQLVEALRWADVVFSATGAIDLVVRTPQVRAALSGRTRPLVLVDLAVPRDIDPDVAALPGVTLYDIDDLQGSLNAAHSARRQEVPKVEAIVDEELAALQTDLRGLTIRPVVAELRQKAEAIRQRELARTLRYLGQMDPALMVHVEHLSRSLVNKLLHEPTVRLKELAHDDRAGAYASAVRDLFGLDGDEPRDEALDGAMNGQTDG
jgi:glutamyl-tRNA reductase